MPQLLYPLRPVGVVALLGYTSSDDRIGEKSPAPAVLQGRCGLALKPQGPSERIWRRPILEHWRDGCYLRRAGPSLVMWAASGSLTQGREMRAW
jgi:hypothetical protein